MSTHNTSNFYFVNKTSRFCDIIISDIQKWCDLGVLAPKQPKKGEIHMKKLTLRTISVLMTLVMLAVCIPFTASAAVLPVNDVPVIHLTGGQAPLTNIETNTSYLSVFNLTPEYITAAFEQIQEGLMDAVKRLDWVTAGQYFSDFVWDMFGELQMYPDGTSKNSLYRTGTTNAGTFDMRNYAAPKRVEPASAMGAFASISVASAEITATADSSEPAEETNFFEQFKQFFFTAFERASGIVDRFKEKQPDPKPEWDNIDSLNLIKGTNHFEFAFDWRRSPIEIADILHDYIQAVKGVTGKDSVCVQSISSSAQVALAYTDKYINKLGYDDVSMMFYSVPMANGSGSIGSVFTKRLLLDARALGFSQIIASMLEPLPEDLQMIFSTLYRLGILDFVGSLFEFMPQTFVDTVIEDGILPCYGYFPGMWALVPPDKLEMAKTATLGARLTDPEYADFIAKIDAYHDIALRQNSILSDAAQKVKLAVVAGYGQPVWPLGDVQGTQGDGNVETKYASFGASCALMGEKLGANYRQIEACCGENHISPDNVVDASTAALPDQTWFVRDLIHGNQFHLNGLFAWWYSTPNPTVFTNTERWPQYLYAVYKDGELSSSVFQTAIYPLQKPVGGVLYNTVFGSWTSLLAKIRDIFFSITGKISDVFRGLFARLDEFSLPF